MHHWVLLFLRTNEYQTNVPWSRFRFYRRFYQTALLFKCAYYDFDNLYNFCIRFFVRTILGLQDSIFMLISPVSLLEFFHRLTVFWLATFRSYLAIWTDGMPSSIICITTFRRSSDFHLCLLTKSSYTNVICYFEVRMCL
jgi:hypothetical protein